MQSANQMRVCGCLRGCNPLNKLCITDWKRGVCLLPHYLEVILPGILLMPCVKHFTCNNRVHVKAIMTDYQDLLRTIKSLQHSRLSYIELLQEEVKRNQDVSYLLMAHSTQAWQLHIHKISNCALGFLWLKSYVETGKFRVRLIDWLHSCTI